MCFVANGPHFTENDDRLLGIIAHHIGDVLSKHQVSSGHTMYSFQLLAECGVPPG